MATLNDVDNFLGRFRTATELRGKAVWKSDKNRQCLDDLGLTEKSATDIIIRDLGSDQYAKGPDPDDLEPAREVWVFGHRIKGVEVYIKVCMDERAGRFIPIVWSFHKAQRPLTYPLKELASKNGE